MKRKAGSLSPPSAKGASSNISSTSSSSSDESESELPTLSTDSSLKKTQADGDGDCAAVEHAVTPPRTPKSQMHFHCSSPGSPGQSLSAAASRKPTPKAPRKKRPGPGSLKHIKTSTSKAAAAAAEKETEVTIDSEAEEEEEEAEQLLLQDLPEGPETYKELFAYPRMNALELLENHRDHEHHCSNLKKVLQHRLIQHDSFSGLGTASITCKRQLEAMVAVVDARHLDWTWIALSWSS